MTESMMNRCEEINALRVRNLKELAGETIKRVAADHDRLFLMMESGRWSCVTYVCDCEYLPMGLRYNEEFYSHGLLDLGLMTKEEAAVADLELQRRCEAQRKDERRQQWLKLNAEFGETACAPSP